MRITSCTVYVILWPFISKAFLKCTLWCKMGLPASMGVKLIFGLRLRVKPNFPTNLGAGLLPCPSKPCLILLLKNLWKKRRNNSASFPPLQVLAEFSWAGRVALWCCVSPFMILSNPYKWRHLSDRPYRILLGLSYQFFPHPPPPPSVEAVDNCQSWWICFAIVLSSSIQIKLNF